MLSRAGYGHALARQLRAASRLLDAGLVKSLEGFVRDGQTDVFDVLKDCEAEPNHDYVRAVKTVNYKKDLGKSVAEYRAHILNQCGFDVTPSNQPKPVVPLEKLGQIAAAVAAHRGVNKIEEFKDEFGLEKPVEAEAEADNAAAEPAADADADAPPQEEPQPAMAAKRELPPADLGPDQDDVVDIDEPAEAPAADAAATDNAAMEDVLATSAVDEEPEAPDASAGEKDGAITPPPPPSAKDAAARPAPEDDDDADNAAFARYEPDTLSEQLSARFSARTLSTTAAPRAYSVVADAATAADAAGDDALKHQLPGAVAMKFDALPEASAVAGVETAHARDAHARYLELQRTYSRLVAAGDAAAGQWAACMLQLRDTVRALAEARLHTMKGAVGLGDAVGVEALCELAAIYCRPVERTDTEEYREANPAVQLRENVAVSFGETPRSNKSRFPPPAAYREHLTRLDRVSPRDPQHTKDSFLDTHAALAPLLTSLATLVSRDLSRRHAQAAAAPAAAAGAAPPAPVESEVAARSVFQTFAEKATEATEATTRIPSIRKAHLAALINGAQGMWHTNYMGEACQFQVQGLTIAKVIPGKPPKRERVGRLEHHNGEITWQSVAELKGSGTPQQVRFKLVHTWEHMESFSSKLETCMWIHPDVDATKTPKWHRDATRLARVEATAPPRAADAAAKARAEEEDQDAAVAEAPQESLSDYRETRSTSPAPPSKAKSGFVAPPPPAAKSA